MTTVHSAARTTAPETATESSRGVCPLIGTALCRFIVPIWLLAGAIFKLWDMNPNVLPKPVLNAVFGMADLLAIEDLPSWLMLNMRTMIGIELALVGIMLFVPRLARAAAILILSVFTVVMVLEIVPVFSSKAFARDAWATLLKPCGCFGAWSPPAIVTLAIDLTFLIGCLMCRPGIKGRTVPGPAFANIALVGSVILGGTIAFARPPRTMVIETQPVVAGDPQPPVSPKEGTAPVADPAPTPPEGPAPTAAAKEPWPAYPAKLAVTYVILDKRLIGKPFTSLPVAALFANQSPEAMRTGRTHLVFYRENCDHCFELLNKHFSGALPTPTFSVEVPDSVPGKRYPNPCKECAKLELPSGPDYMILTPLVMTLVDGVVVAICNDTDKPGALDMTMNAWLPGHENDVQVDGMLLAPYAAASGAATTPIPAVPTTPAPTAGRAFPPKPELAPYYTPGFEKWPGKRFDQTDLGPIITRPHPFDLNTGAVCVIFYRVDCDHCQEMMREYFSDTLPCPTVAVAIPDASGEPLEMECTQCKLATLPAGPMYVIESPVIVVIVDGVVKCVVSGQQVEDEAIVKACLPATK
ncbi:MAG: hypothetical protein SGJ11_05890 [Phycisphaerae bacterium]|nr:hypothetical protein [Phycisphaerae bacterium]